VRARESATLRGRVTDRLGAPLAGATVALKSPSHPSVNQLGAVADLRGEYRLVGLPAADDYEVTCSFPGFATLIRRPVRLAAGGSTVVDCALPEDLVETLVVTCPTDIVDTDARSTSSCAFPACR
jgi:hypothetical protein